MFCSPAGLPMSVVDVLPSASHPAPPRPAAVTGVSVLPPKGLNTSIYLDLNRLSRHTAWAHGFMHTYALWLGPVLLAALFAVAYGVAWWRHAPRASALLVLGGVGTVVALGLNQIVGHAARELRPYVAHPEALVLVAKANDYAFPSDHSVVAGGLTLSILLVLGRRAWLRHRPCVATPPDRQAPVPGAPGAVRAAAAAAVVLGLFLCFARVYVGAHYPGDVVAGYLLAASVVAVASLLRPLAYRMVDIVGPTAWGRLLARPAAATRLEP
jgi:membrane-associated phospholipid phosphatase